MNYINEKFAKYKASVLQRPLTALSYLALFLTASLVTFIICSHTKHEPIISPIVATTSTTSTQQTQALQNAVAKSIALNKKSTGTNQLEYMATTIRGSIFLSGKKSGLPTKITAELLNIFSNKVNFHSIHDGDKFAVLYQKKLAASLDSPKPKKHHKNNKTTVATNGNNIVAAELTHNGKTYRAVKFTDASGSSEYYSPDGYSLKAPFIRYPLKFKFISSPFSLHRFHPILGIYRSHLGVDFAADIGTPIKASSDGIISFAGYKENYGRVVIVSHGIYSSLYAHLNAFANIHHGQKVKQGQTIAYLGNSGLSTGPHLHYEFRINGVHYDPIKVKLPATELIAKQDRPKFFAQTKILLAQLDTKRNSMLALNSSKNTSGSSN